MQTAGVDRLSALNLAIELVRRGGTISLSGVYGGTADPLNMLQMFDKQLHAADGPGQRPALGRRHPAAARAATTTRSASTPSPPTTSRSTEAPAAYEMFQKKQDGAFKVVFQPGLTERRRHRSDRQRRHERRRARWRPTSA